MRRCAVKKGLFITIVIAFMFPAFFAYEASAQHLTASGCSVSNVGYLSDLAKDYEKLTGIKIFVRGGGSVIGLEDLRSGNVDFAASCREGIEGDPEDIEFIPVAWDALVFIVHKSNPVNGISMETARAIYAGKTANWKELKGNDAPIKVFLSRPTKGLSGVESSTRKMILNGVEPPKTPNTSFMASTAIVEQMVEKTPEGFATTGFSSARKRDVKLLKVSGAAPSKENIVAGRYPLKRPLFLVVPKNPKPEVKKFVEFVLSKKGQRLISSYGVISLLDMK